VTFEDVSGELILPASPFERYIYIYTVILFILFILRRRASIQPSREVSDVSDIEGLPDPGQMRVEEGTESDWSEMTGRLDREIREMRRNRQSLARKREREVGQAKKHREPAIEAEKEAKEEKE
jgi:hypothetical protein